MDTVLIIDDDETTRKVLEALLTRAGFKVYLASSGDEGIRFSGRNVLASHWSIL